MMVRFRIQNIIFSEILLEGIPANQEVDPQEKIKKLE
jgi:hypothetical protein